MTKTKKAILAAMSLFFSAPLFAPLPLPENLNEVSAEDWQIIKDGFNNVLDLVGDDEVFIVISMFLNTRMQWIEEGREDGRAELSLRASLRDWVDRNRSLGSRINKGIVPVLEELFGQGPFVFKLCALNAFYPEFFSQIRWQTLMLVAQGCDFTRYGKLMELGLARRVLGLPESSDEESQASGPEDSSASYVDGSHPSESASPDEGSPDAGAPGFPDLSRVEVVTDGVAVDFHGPVLRPRAVRPGRPAEVVVS